MRYDATDCDVPLTQGPALTNWDIRWEHNESPFSGEPAKARREALRILKKAGYLVVIR